MGMRTAVWWASVSNTVGGFNFLIAPLPAFLAPHWHGKHMWTDVNYCVGSALFAVSSTLMLVMWRADNFGLTLLKQLNVAVNHTRAAALENASSQGLANDRTSRPRTSAHQHAFADQGADGESQRFSIRGTVFIIAYCWFSVTAIVGVLCKQLWSAHAVKEHSYRHVADVITGVFIVCYVQLVLMVHSVVTHVPKMQPFRAVVLGSRAFLILGAIGQTLLIVDFIAIDYDVIS